MAVNYNPRSVTDGLVLHIDPSNPRSYPGNGTTIFDMSGNGNNGTLTNMNVPACYVRTYGGRALDFDGVNDYVLMSQNARFLSALNSTLFTISAWINLRSTTTCSPIISPFNRTTETQISFSVGDNFNGNLGRLVIGVGNTGGFVQVIGTTTLNLNTWYLATAINLANTYMVYLNTQKEAQQATIYYGTRYSDYTFGRESWNPAKYLNGQLDDIRIYNRALSAAEIQQNYNATRGRFGV